MLAVRIRPRMGSSQPPPEDPFMPFGYSVEPNEPFFDPPPEPPPGDPLLTETDNKFLSNFFDDMTANQYSMPSFGEGLSFNDVWLDLPPQFMGTATSFSQQQGHHYSHGPGQGVVPNPHANPAASLSGPLGLHSMPPPIPAPLQPTYTSAHMSQNEHSDDVLHAAATLVRNGNSVRRSSTAGSDNLLPSRSIPVGHLRHQPLEEFREDGRRSNAAETFPDDSAYADWIFAPRDRTPSRSTPNVAPPAFQFGTDVSFSGGQGYTADSNQDSLESRQKEQLKALGILGANKNATVAQPTSPSQRQHDGARFTNHDRPQASPIKPPEDADAPPRKRRKSKIVRDADEDGGSGSTTLPTPKSASKKKASKEDTSPTQAEGSKSGAAGRRRKSAANGASALAMSKAARENLSEEQKRENHIKSEQKRRTVIKEGFDELCQLVPGLKGGGFSKSTMLGMTAEHLEEILKGNEILKQQLASLER